MLYGYIDKTIYIYEERNTKTTAGEEATGFRSVSGHYGQSAFGKLSIGLCSLKIGPHLVVPFGEFMGSY